MTHNLTACSALHYQVGHSINKEEYSYPRGSGCGSVETCRSAAHIIMVARSRIDGGRAIGAGMYGNCSAEKRQEDLPVHQR